MAKLRLPLLSVLAGTLLSFGVAQAQTSTSAIANPNRIVNPIDESQLVTLRGNVNPAAIARNDRGAVSSSLSMTDLIMVLSRSSERQAAFEAFVASQYDPSSPNYHQWLTPDQVGEQYGPSLSDVSTVTSWLTGHGFTVTKVNKDRMAIHFDGTAGLVASTFHTSIHNLVVNGKSHIGNMSDPKIPTAIAPVVVGIKSLHNFFPRPAHHMGQLVQRDPQSHGWVRQNSAGLAGKSLAQSAAGASSTAATARAMGTLPSAAAGTSLSTTAKPQFGATGTYNGSSYVVEDVGPWDFATIYNVAPLWSAGVDGTGQTIAIAGTSAINIGESSSTVAGANGINDVLTFRTFFDLPTGNSYNTPIQISGNSQPLTVCTSTATNATCGLGDLEENTLDVEWSGAVAKNAQIILVASYPASSSDDNLYDSASYIVDNLTAHIMNVSYGQCELGLGTAGNVAYYNLWQTAAAEGIAVFVSSGDSGSASCDAGGDSTNGVPYPAEYGLSVNGLASTPYNTAVGGTDFNWCPLTSSDNCVSEAATYWNSSNNATTQASAKGYVPEVPWNDTCTSPVTLSFMESYFAGYPYTASNNNSYSVTDAETGCNAIQYYSYFNAIPDTVVLDLVDTVGTGGGASGCIVNDNQTVASCASSATSTGSSYSSIPLYNNGWVKPSWQTGVTGILNDGVRDIPDVSFFAADGFLSSSAYLMCVSAASNNTECSYSTTSEPTAQEVGGTSVASPAMAGVMALINQKSGASQGSPNSQLYTLATRQTYSSCSAENGTTSSNCYFNDVDTGANAMACNYSYLTNTPSPNCTPSHSGDYLGILPGYSATMGYDASTGLGSLNVANVVNAWTAEVTASFGLANSGDISITAGATSGNTSTVTVTPSNGFTGTVDLSCSVSPSGSSSPTCSIPSSVTISSAAQTATVTANSTATTAAGTYAVTVTATSGSITQTSIVNVTVTAAPTFAISNSGSLSIAPGATTGNTSSVTVTPANSFTGTVSLSCAVTSTPSGATSPVTCSIPASVAITGTSAQAATLTVNSTSTTTTGAYVVTVTAVSGSITQTSTVDVTVTTSASFSLSNSGAIAITGGATTGNTSTITVTPANGFTGTVALTCAVTSTPSGATSPVTCSIPASVAITGTTAQTAALTVSSAATTTAGTYVVTVTATSGSSTQTSNVNVTVTAPVTFFLANGGGIAVAAGATSGNTSTITVTPSGGFTGTVNLACAVTTAPSGATSPVTCSIPSSVSITGTMAKAAALTVSSTTSTTTGAYAVTVTATSGSITQTSNVNVTITPPASFTLTNGGNISVAAGATSGNTSTITVTPANAFTGAVALTCAVTSAPSGATSPVTCALSPSSVTITGLAALTSTLTVSSTSSTTGGAYAVTVTATSASITQTTPVTVTVSNFALSASGNISVTRGATTGNTSTISVTPAGGFTGTVNLTCSISPTASNDPATCSLSSSSVSITGTTAQTATLTIGTTAATSASNHPEKLFWPATGGTVLAIAFFFVPRRRRNWLSMFVLLVLVVSGLAIGCGGGSGGGGGSSNSGTTPGTYTVTITGTSGSNTKTTTVTLTVS